MLTGAPNRLLKVEENGHIWYKCEAKTDFPFRVTHGKTNLEFSDKS